MVVHRLTRSSYYYAPAAESAQHQGHKISTIFRFGWLDRESAGEPGQGGWLQRDNSVWQTSLILIRPRITLKPKCNSCQPPTNSVGAQLKMPDCNPNEIKLIPNQGSWLHPGLNRQSFHSVRSKAGQQLKFPLGRQHHPYTEPPDSYTGQLQL